MNALSTQAEQHSGTTQIWLAAAKGVGKGEGRDKFLVVDPMHWIHYHILPKMQWGHTVEFLP